jgi:hypothetical protein
MIEDVRSCAREDLLRSPALSLAPWGLATYEQFQLLRSSLKRSQCQLPQERVTLIAQESVEIAKREVVLAFPKAHRTRRKATADSRQFIAIGDKNNEADGAMLLGLQGR